MSGAVTQPTVITSNPFGGYNIRTKSNDNPLSTLYDTDYAFTLWGARRLAKKQRLGIAKEVESARFREVLHPNCRCIND